MKKFLITSIVLLSVVLVSSFTSINLNPEIKDVLGTWNYSVPNAPIEYQKGQLILEEKKGKLSGYTKVGDFKNEIEKPKLEDKTLTFTMYIEDTEVNFSLNFEKDKFSGKVTYSEGTLNMTGVKQE